MRHRDFSRMEKSVKMREAEAVMGFTNTWMPGGFQEEVTLGCVETMCLSILGKCLRGTWALLSQPKCKWGLRCPGLAPLTFSTCHVWCLSNLPSAGQGGASMQVRLPWPPESMTCQVGRKGTHWSGRHPGWLSGCPALLPSPQLSMKAYLTLLSYLGRLHEPPVPKPRGTPKLSERYAGLERFSGPWW